MAWSFDFDAEPLGVVLRDDNPGRVFVSRAHVAPDRINAGVKARSLQTVLNVQDDDISVVGQSAKE